MSDDEGCYQTLANIADSVRVRMMEQSKGDTPWRPVDEQVIEVFQRYESELQAADAEITRLKEALEVANQLVLEINHAYRNGPEWYTRGESGLRQQVGMWIDKASKSITDALNNNK